MHDEQKEQDRWIWLALAAAGERALEQPERPWGEGDGIAEILATMALEPGAMRATVGGGYEAPESPIIPAANGWLHLLEHLTEWLKLSLDYKKPAGARVWITPYHLHAATEPEHPQYSPRVLRMKDIKRTTAMARALVAVGQLDAVKIVAHRDFDDWRYYVRAGRGRLAGARLADHWTLAKVVGEIRACKMGWQLEQVDPPELPIRFLKAEIIDSSRADVEDHASNFRGTPEDLLETAEAIRMLREAGLDNQAIQDAKQISEDSIANYFALLALAPDVREGFRRGDFIARVAYRLGRVESHERQRQALAKTRDIPPNRRLEAIEQVLAGHAISIPQNVAPPVPAKTIRLAAQRARETPGQGALHVAGVVARILAGEPKAAEELPEGDREQILELLRGPTASGSKGRTYKKGEAANSSPKPAKEKARKGGKK